MSNCCESCSNYEYDDDYECYTCLINLDEDELYHFITNQVKACPYYSYDDEYKIVRHQM